MNKYKHSPTCHNKAPYNIDKKAQRRANNFGSCLTGGQYVDPWRWCKKRKYDWDTRGSRWVWKRMVRNVTSKNWRVLGRLQGLVKW